jgi:dihydrofolate reductase
MIVSAILAMSKNRVIGANNEIPWYLPADFAYFKRTTMGHHILMGRLTFLSLGRPLPKRTNIVVTRNPFFTASGCLVVHSVEEGLALAQDAGETEVFIIGGGQIYRESMPYWDRLYLTEVDAEIEGDTFFPELDDSEWRLVRSEAHPADDKNEYPYTFKLLERVL